MKISNTAAALLILGPCAGISFALAVRGESFFWWSLIGWIVLHVIVIEFIGYAKEKSETQMQPVSERTEGGVMRTLGWLFSPLADLSWFLTILVSAGIFLIPGLRNVSMPLVGGSVFQFFLDFGIPFGFAVLILNGLSGRWGPEKMRGVDRWTTIIALVSLVIICCIVFFLRWGYDTLPRQAIIWLLSMTGLALYDHLIQQGEEYRASSSRGVHAQAAAAAQVLGVNAVSSIPNPMPLSLYNQILQACTLGRDQLYEMLLRVRITAGGQASIDIPDVLPAEKTVATAT